MVAVVFHKLKNKSIERELFEHLTALLVNGERALVRLASEDEMDALDSALWAVEANSFLPHATARGHHSSEQPVLLTVNEEVTNNAKTLFLLPGAEVNNLENFNNVIVLFDEERPSHVAAARVLWQSLKKQGMSLTLQNDG